ncbi:uncharacterized protein LOC125377288 [Haliotis rufescens]|uniref:uncharacterized protein LOC125377288 n=1 Tax=Haliotis rufescens TaxID=6454 RepID=UPI00201E7BBC|nr:uncharacterized protein LOC125377288 [Haliotis rufescens]
MSHKSIKLEVQAVSSSTSTTATIEPQSTTTTTTQPPSTTLYSTESVASVTKGLSTPVYSPSSSEQRMTSVTQVNLTNREETDDTQWYIILPGALGGLAVVSLVIFLVWRNRTSRKRNLPRSIQK